MREVISFAILSIGLQVAHAQEMAYVESSIDTLVAVKPKTTTSFSEKGVKTMPFELVGGLIFVRAESNGKDASYILDSGAPALILNNSLTEGDDQNKICAVGLSGKTSVEHIPDVTFDWGGEQRHNQRAYKMDISHLEQLKQKHIGGLIGYDLIKDKELLINYKTKEISFYTKRKFRRAEKPKFIIPFKMEAHFAVIEAKIGRKTYRFALDTAAEANLLDAKHLKKIKNDAVGKIEEVYIQGTDKQRRTAAYCTIRETLVKGEVFENMDFVFTSIKGLNKMYNMDIDGLLGFPFLSNRKISVDYKRNKIYVWE